ncbi:hypothetical protein CONLIGDRAFT_43193 [Coniochaeta ligniaria NRRL 30616]|uniref:Uncharacterized protein n=1 Tax=Coniochaeta ligniaria NRRL 30616 TaxID=1408157 RepID=A0A1J7K4L6_9PEZI|nr:hypothetical protein CONLIGDRAFT_43193 [Coniochaeta ligniaria NRRL 30616]
MRQRVSNNQSAYSLQISTVRWAVDRGRQRPDRTTPRSACERSSQGADVLASDRTGHIKVTLAIKRSALGSTCRVPREGDIMFALHMIEPMTTAQW